MSWFTESMPWRSGPWSLHLRGDEFADIAFGERVVLRSVRAVVRDQDWGTADLVVDYVDEGEDTLTLHVHSADLGSSFRGTVRVQAHPTSLNFHLDLESNVDFHTNRTGLVVLHPPNLAGVEVQVRHERGPDEQTRFPRTISPHQPVKDITALSWTVDGVEASTEFSGDIFEMEDQRNWTDASYKTYSRPLSLPFPYLVRRGDHIVQSMTLHAARHEDLHPPLPKSTMIELRAEGSFPAIGLGAATARDPAPAPQPLGREVLVELDLASTNWRAALHRALADGLPLDVRFLLDHTGHVTILDGVATLAGLPVVRVAAFHQSGGAAHVSDRAAVADLRAALTVAGLEIPVVGGSRSHFTELNREQSRIPDDLDGVTVTVTPMFHSASTEQLVESVAIQRLVARGTVAFADERPVHIGPICLRPRFNNVATKPPPGPGGSDLSEGYGAEFTGLQDPRQSAPELAAWTIASAAAMSIPGVASLAWYEQWGPRGIRASDGSPYPVARAIAALASLEGGELLSGDSPDGLLWALGSRSAGITRVLATNIGKEPRELTVRTPDGATTIRLNAGMLTEVNVKNA